ncbi:MAG TPA: hypothetical protein VGL61_30190 [Kofleriaceae bacterium]
MTELFEDADLARESIYVLYRVGAQDLDRDRLAGFAIDRSVHGAHPAGPGHIFQAEPSRDEITQPHHGKPNRHAAY